MNNGIHKSDSSAIYFVSFTNNNKFVTPTFIRLLKWLQYQNRKGNAAYYEFWL